MVRRHDNTIPNYNIKIAASHRDIVASHRDIAFFQYYRIIALIKQEVDMIRQQ
jgi:hypothetical protein